MAGGLLLLLLGGSATTASARMEKSGQKQKVIMGVIRTYMTFYQYLG